MTTAPIKVLQLLVNMPVGGAENMVAEIIAGLDPQKFQVSAACIGAPGPMAEELIKTGYPVTSLGLDIKHTSLWRVVRGVRGLLREIKPDVLHTHLYHPNLYGRLAALGLGLKGVVATVHNIYSQVKVHRCFWNCLLGLLSDYIVVFSPQVWQDVRRYDLVPVSRLRLVSPGVRVDELQVSASVAEAKKRLGVTGFCLGTVARLEEQKGHEYLLAAVQRLRPEMGNLTVLLVGDGQRKEFLKNQALKMGLGETIRFLGTRRDVPQVLRALDIFVQPSLWEGIPLTLLEAMGAGLPVVATKVGRAGEAIQDGENGRLVPPGDSEALASAILELYQQPELRREWGQRAWRTIAAKYSLESMLRQFADLYQTLYEKGRAVE